MRTRAFRSSIVGLLAAAAALAAFPEDADTPTEGWKYGFRSVIDRTQYPAGVVKDTGWTVGTFQDSSKGSDGKTVAGKGKYVTVWRKGADGKWKAIHDIWNYDTK